MHGIIINNWCDIINSYTYDIHQEVKRDSQVGQKENWTVMMLKVCLQHHIRITTVDESDVTLQLINTPCIMLDCHLLCCCHCYEETHKWSPEAIEELYAYIKHLRLVTEQ